MADKKWLVINNSRTCTLPFADRYRVYTKPEDAFAWAKTQGFENPYNLPVPDAIGMASVYQAWNIDILVMPVLEDMHE